VSIAVALADKLDTLTGFWAIDEKPTGSKDPYALRRAALGVIRIVLDNELNFSIDPLNDVQVLSHQIGSSPSVPEKLNAILSAAARDGMFGPNARARIANAKADAPEWLALVEQHDPSISDDLRAFLQDRLKVYLRDKCHKYDQIDAVLTDADGNLQDDLVLIVAKLEALEAFLKTDDGANLAAAYKRAANILKAEEKKEKGAASGAVDENLLKDAEEKALFAALKDAETAAGKAVASEDFEAAMAALSKLRGPLDAFFEKVTVNADDKALRANRLALLARLVAATATVADFSKLEG
jgi:glycyl-tRNA synthetase beta chain